MNCLYTTLCSLRAKPATAALRAFSLRTATALLVSCGVLHLAAATTTVSSLSALQSAINGAHPGDVIILANGTYTASGAINVGVAGTATAPITVEAATIGGATIGGSDGFHFTSSAAYATVQGFVFTHSAGKAAIDAGASHCRFTRNVFKCSGTGANLNVMGDDSVIDYNEFGPKSVTGQMMEVEGPSGRIAQHVWVHHNYFHDFSPVSGNGQEDIRFGLSGISLTNSFSTVEYNLFLRCSGENETISNKSSSTTYRYNTLLDCKSGGQISQRHGNHNTYYGNYVKNSSGIRIYGDDNVVYSNYLEGNDVGINIGNGDANVESGGALTSHDRPDRTIIVYNTLVNNTTQYEMNGRSGGLGATSTTFANNIIQGGSTAVSIASSPYTNPVWLGNIIWSVGSIGNIPSSGYTSVNPLLATDANGIFHLQSGSPAINAGKGSYPQVTVDMDGQARDSAPDIGADEISSAPITAKFLTPADVGPNANTTPQVAAPNFSPPPGTYTSAQSVSITTATSGASIRYTTDGSAPTETHGTLYSGPVSIGSTTVLQAIAYASGSTDSSVISGTYTINISNPPAAAPVFSPGGGTYSTAQNVTITSSTSGASIRYTTDGSNPSETAGTLYSGPVNISNTASPTTLKAIAYAAGFTDSAVTSGIYTISVTPPPTLNFEAESLSYTPSGATASVQTDANSSGGHWVMLAGNSVGDYINFAIPSVPAGTYQLRMEWKGLGSRGILRLSVDGTNLGSTLDQYSASATYPTTTFGNVTFSSAGTHTVRLTVTGKNSKSSSYQLSADKFTFVGQ